tara:strand:+ start:2618 stop:3391 length:774 start_codon:yes stop_codon:yes gene_type:complete
MHPIINMALRLARTGSEKAILASARLDRLKIVSNDPSDFSSSMDYEINELIVSGLQKAYPTHTIKSRIGESIIGLDTEPSWLIDPLFGSLNFFKGNPSYGVSVAIELEGELKHTVLILPEYDQEFLASKGNGAQLNKTKCRVDPKGNFDSSLLGVCLGQQNVQSSMKLAALLSQTNSQIRMSGCSAFDMLMVCANKLGAGYCEASHSYSERAATLVLSESGALISSETGDPSLEKALELYFGAPRIFKEIVKLRMQI